MDNIDVRQRWRKAHEDMIEPGSVWVHYKGGKYIVSDVVCSEEDPEEVRVVYRSLKDGYKWSRKIESWLSYTEQGVKRFRPVTPWRGLLFRVLHKIT